MPCRPRIKPAENPSFSGQQGPRQGFARAEEKGRKHYTAPIHAKPVGPIHCATAELWEDHRIFKAAALLHERRKKWAAYLSEIS